MGGRGERLRTALRTPTLPPSRRSSCYALSLLVVLPAMILLAPPASVAPTADTGLLHTLSQLGPVATGVAVMVALAVGFVTVRQRREADRRDQWWKRAQWALDLVMSPSESQSRAAVGFAVLERLASSELARREELLVLEAAWQVWLFPVPDDPLSEWE